MKTKRVNVLSILSLILLSTSLIYAETCSGDNLLFSLNAQTNAHAETSTQTNYVQDVCYQTVMGVSPPSGASRTCTTSNTILSLSSATNAHAEDPDLSNYATDICYEGLICDVVSDPTAGSGCTLGDGTSGSVVARISSLTNAHVELASAGGNYPYEVCCRLSTSLVWKRPDGSTIASGSTVYVGDTIRATATTTTDTSKLFTLEERDGSGEDTIVSSVSGSVSGSDLIYSFTPTGDSNDGPTAGTIDAILDHSSDPPSPGAFELFFSVSGLSLESYSINIGYCGDKSVYVSEEECDDGYDDTSPNNGDVCTPTFQSGCSYCDASCNTITLPQLRYGDGIISSPENCDCGSEALGTIHTNSAHLEGECALGLGNQNTCTDDGDGSCAYCDASNGQLVVLNFADVFWANLLGGKITEAEIGDTVMLRYPGGISQTNSRDFLVFEDDTLFSDTYVAEVLGVGDDLLLNLLTGYSTDSNNDGTEDDILGIWTINEAGEIDSYLAGESDLGDVKFQIATSSGTKAVKEADKLEILAEGALGAVGNDDLELELIGPLCGSDLIASETPSDIEFSLTDTDDLVSYTITINGLETIVSEPTWIPGKSSFKVPYVFNQVGVTNIRIDGESKRGDLITIFSNVIVREEIPGEEITFVASCISSPAQYADIDNDYANFEANVIAKRESSSIDFDSPEADISPSDILYKWTYSDGMSFEATGDEPIATVHTKYFLTKGKNNWATLEAELI